MAKRKYDLDNMNETWLNRTWRPMAAIVYLVICLFDFIIAPAFLGIRSGTAQQLADSVKGLDPSIAIALIQHRVPWQPLTLQGSGLFHVAFGAILGVAAWTRGSAQIEYIRQQGESERSPYTPTMVPTYYLPAATGQPVVPQTMVSPIHTPVQPTPSTSSKIAVDAPDAE